MRKKRKRNEPSKSFSVTRVFGFILPDFDTNYRTTGKKSPRLLLHSQWFFQCKLVKERLHLHIQTLLFHIRVASSQPFVPYSLIWLCCHNCTTYGADVCQMPPYFINRLFLAILQIRDNQKWFLFIKGVLHVLCLVGHPFIYFNSIRESMFLRLEEFGIEGLNGRWGGDNVPRGDRSLQSPF